MKRALRVVLIFAIATFICSNTGFCQGSHQVFLPMEHMRFATDKENAEYNKRIQQEAIQAGECKPAELDPEGHWGKVLAGLQVSIRAPTNIYVKGQTNVLYTILRNTTTNVINITGAGNNWYVLVIYGSANQKLDEWRGGNGSSMGLPGFRLSGNRQQKEVFDVTARFSSMKPGDYQVQALRLGLMRSETGEWQELRSGMFAIKIVDPPAPK